MGGTAELKNDPRFFTENVIDKRLAAFEAMAIVTELMSAEAVKQCFELSKEFVFRRDLPIMGLIQMTGFLLMCTVMGMATVATAVLSLQLFFTIRLMTAGPTGFDRASRFYQDNRMWRWRERAIFSVKFSMVFMFVASGFLLCSKFYKDAVASEREHHKHTEVEKMEHLIIAGLVLAVFLSCAGCIAWLVHVHQKTFDESYFSVDMCYSSEMQACLATPLRENTPNSLSWRAQ